MSHHCATVDDVALRHHRSGGSTMTLTEQRILVIGGSSGMGLATARAAAHEGAAVTVASSSRERGDAALAELPANCDGAVLDVRDESSITALFERVSELD